MTVIVRHPVGLMLRSVLQAVMLFCASAITAHAAESQAHPRVGLVVGTAVLIGPAGEALALKPGLLFRPGSRIQTGADSMVVVVFPDNARLSLRADSELILHQYVVDNSGNSTRMELELLRGAVRQISGTATHSKPDRYRLNTPVAAIGIRGTDFLAKIQGQSLEAIVNKGEIIITPSGDNCGFVINCVAIDLTSGSSEGAYLRLENTGRIQRRHLDLKDIETIFGMGTPTAARPSDGPSIAGDFDWPKETNRYPSPIVFTVGAGSPLDLTRSFDPPVEVFPPSQEPPQGVTQLVWGRFGEQPELLQYQTLQPYVQASRDRHVRVGLIGQLALWRANPNGDLDRGLSGSVEFRLAQSEAFLHQVAQVSPASVQQAQLRVDFDRSQFSTIINVTHAQTGMQTLQLSGRVNSEGTFNAVSAQDIDRVAGALSRDGREAGMLFVKQVPQGSLQGVTLWRK